MSRNIGNTVITLGILASVLFFIAGIILLISSIDLTTLRSVKGTTVAESYYQQIGYYGIAYSLASFAFGFFSLTLSIGIGNWLILRQKPAIKSVTLDKKCPSCAESILLEAFICKYCHHEFKKDDILNRLSYILKDGSYQAKNGALNILLDLKDPSLTHEVLNLIDNAPPEQEVLIKKSLKYLTTLRVAGTSKELVNILCKSKNFGLLYQPKVLMIINAIKEIGDPECLPLLVELLKNKRMLKHNNLKKTLVYTIAAFGNDAIPHLENVANESDKTSRKLANALINHINS